MKSPNSHSAKHRAGAGLSLTKLAAGRASTYDPRRVRAAELQRGATVVGAYRKLKRKTEGQRPAPRLSVEVRLGGRFVQRGL